MELGGYSHEQVEVPPLQPLCEWQRASGTNRTQDHTETTAKRKDQSLNKC